MTIRAGPRPDPWSRAWRVLASDRALVIWIGLVAFSALTAIWFPQVPRSAHQQNGGAETWLTTVRPQLGRPADTLLALGILSVSRAVWFRLILAGTGFTLLLRAFDSTRRLIRLPAFPPGDQVITQELTLVAEPAAALQAVSRELGRDLRRRHAGDHRLLADRPLAHICSLCTTLGELVIMVGWLWTASSGWETPPMRLTEGAAAGIPASGQTLKVEALQVQWGDAGAPAEASAQLVLQDGGPAAAGKADLKTAWHWRGVTYSLSGVGPAVWAEGVGPDGEPLLLRTVAYRPAEERVTLLLPAEDGVRSFAAPVQGVVVQAAAEPSEGRPLVRLRVYQGQAGELVEDRIIHGEASLAVDGSRFDLGIVPYAEITASHSPGRLLLTAGIVLALAGVSLTLAYRPRCLEVTATAQRSATQLTLRVARPSDSAWLTTLVSRLEPGQTGGEHGD